MATEQQQTVCDIFDMILRTTKMQTKTHISKQQQQRKGNMKKRNGHLAHFYRF